MKIVKIIIFKIKKKTFSFFISIIIILRNFQNKYWNPKLKKKNTIKKFNNNKFKKK